MAVRRESVEIAVSSNLASVAARDAAAVQLLARNLDSLGRNATTSNRATTQASRSLSGMSTEAAKVQRTVSTLAAAEGAATKARNTVADATGRVRVAEQRLAELREKGNAKQSQLIAGEEALAKARRELAEVSVRARAASKRLAEVNAPVAESLDRVTESTTQAARSTRQADNSINQLTGRLKVAAQAALVLGPALVPIGALAVPALSGLATQLGFAAAAGGTAVLAFQGVGDAVTALNEAVANPTADNLAKAREELETLSPAAQNFALAIGEMRDEFRDVQGAAAGGLFGELNPELDHVLNLLDRFQPILREIGSATGDMLGDGLESLDSARWEDFFNYLETQARPTLTDLGQAVGDFAHGFAEVLMALDPASQGFGDWVADVADSFDDWAAGLEGSEGLENFLAYVRESGPQVASTMGALATAVGDIVMAAQPLGGPVLEAIQLIAEGLSAVAGTQAGAKIITMAAAFVALSKAMSLVAKAAGAAGFAGVASRIGNTSLLGPGGTRQIQQSTAAIGAFGTAAGQTQRSTMGLRTAMSSVYKSFDPSKALLPANQLRDLNARAAEGRGVLAGYGRAAAVGAAGAAAFALAASDTGSKLGVQNTAMLGLMGSMAGPWGAAVGVGIGALIDFQAAGDNAAAAMDALQEALSGADPTALTSGIEQATSASETLSGQSSTLGNLALGLSGAFGGSGLVSSWLHDRQDQTDALDEQIRVAQEASVAYEQLARTMAGSAPVGPINNMEKYRDVLERLPSMMEDLGVSQQDLTEMAPGGFQGMYADYVSETESARGKTDELRSAMQGLSDPLMLAADSASQLAAAMDGIFGPTLAAEAATDAWRESLQGLKDLNVGAGFTDMTVKGRENNAVTRQAVQATQAMIAARVEAGAGEREVAGLLQESRREFIRNGIAAGVNADVIRRRANELKLTPKMVRTVFREAGIGPIEQKARDLKASYKAMPKEVRTMIRANNLPTTERGMKRLQRQYNLTPKQKTTLVRLRDLASKNLAGVLRGIGAVDKKKANPKVSAETGQFDGKVRGIERMLGMVNNKKTNPKIDADIGGAMGKANTVRGGLDSIGRMRPTPTVGVNDAASGTLAGIRSGLAGIQSKTVTVTVVTNRVGKAAGGPVYGPGTATSDSIPAMLSNGEYVVKTAAVNKYGLGLLDNINTMRLAEGGLASRERAGVEAAMRSSSSGSQRVNLNATGRVRIDLPNGRSVDADLIWNTATEAAQAVMADRDEQAFVESTRYAG